MNRRIQPTGYDREKDVATLKLSYNKEVKKKCPHWFGSLLIKWYWFGMSNACYSLLNTAHKNKKGITLDQVRKFRDSIFYVEAEFDKKEYYNK